MTSAYLHDRTASPQLRHDAASAPHVNRRAVISFAQEQLRRAVPQRDNAGGVPIGAIILRRGIKSSQAEVRQLEGAISGQENVRGLHVTVKDIVAGTDSFSSQVAASHDMNSAGEIKLRG